jgi:hypothetical protein
MPTWDDVVALGARLPGVEVTTSYGTPALKVAGAFMCRLRTDPDALVLRVVDLGEREARCRASPPRSSPRRTTTATRRSWCAWTPSTPTSSPS